MASWSDRSIGGRGTAHRGSRGVAGGEEAHSLHEALGAAGQPRKGVEVVDHERAQPVFDAQGERLMLEVLGRGRIVGGGQQSRLLEGVGNEVGDVQLAAQDQRPVDQSPGLVAPTETAQGRDQPG